MRLSGKHRFPLSHRTRVKGESHRHAWPALPLTTGAGADDRAGKRQVHKVYLISRLTDRVYTGTMALSSKHSHAGSGRLASHDQILLHNANAGQAQVAAFLDDHQIVVIVLAVSVVASQELGIAPHGGKVRGA